MGFSPGGIQRKEEVDANTLGQIGAMEQSNQAMQRAQQVERNRISGLLGEKPFQPSRTYAALDVMEAGRTGDQKQLDVAVTGAQAMGVENPKSILNGADDLKYRQTLDSALGQAKTPEEIAALKARGTRYGVPAEAFDRRAKWWETNRR
jgi:hypothetical protein